ncbi:MAG: bile acid transporter [Gammaproteobacteria bacterium]|nr:bile acid transporter [Gammaproteobacteria bacterium]
MASLIGLLLAVGLRLTAGQLLEALRRCRLSYILLANFVGVPLIVVLLVQLFQLEAELALGMILLGAAPFAPVVPVFARMARADLALAAGLTSLIPFVSAFLSPIVCLCAIQFVPGAGALRFNVLGILGTLLATITAPLLIGVVINQLAPGFKRRVLRPVEIASEATGALSLIVVTISEFHSIMEIGWVPLLAMLISCELSLALGYFFGASERAARRVVALGTSNRNIALALLLAIDSFAGTGVVSAVVANGVLLILLGLLHVAFWRFRQDNLLVV